MRLGIVIFVALFAPCSVTAQATAAEMQLEQFEQLALEHNPTLGQVQANGKASAALARQGASYPNPTVGYYSDEVRGGSGGGGKQGGFFSQTLVTGGKLKAARQSARAADELTESAGAMQRLRLLNDVRIDFYQVLVAQQLVSVREGLANLATESAHLSLQLANIGQADRPDVLQAEVEQQQAAVALQIARLTLSGAWRTLAAVAGRPSLPQTTVQGDLEAIPELAYDEWLAVTLRDSPQIQMAQKTIQRAEASLVQARKVPIPDLQLSANFSQNNELQETTRKPTGLNGGVQIGVELPLFNRNQGNIAAARYQAESARNDLVRARLEVTRAVADRFRSYESARIAVRQYKAELLPRAEEAYRLYRNTYRNMAAAYPQVLLSQRTLFQLEADYVQALSNAWRGALEIRGFGLVDGLMSPQAR